MSRHHRVFSKQDTALHRAAGRGHAKLVAFLLAAGADPNLCNHMGQTPLRWAVTMKNDEAATALRTAARTQALKRRHRDGHRNRSTR